MTGALDNAIQIRRFRSADAAACKRLYEEGLVGGALAPNDTGLDIDDIQGVYMNSPGSCFWVAHTPAGEVVGMLGVQHHEEQTAEIRRLRVRRDQRRRGIGSALLEQALQFCHERHYLKLILDTYVEPEPTIALFEKFRFRLSRRRDVHQRNLMYFYLDLYSGPGRPGQARK